MPIPAVLAGLAKGYIADQAMNKLGVPQDAQTAIRALSNPKGYVRDKIAEAVKEKVGVGGKSKESEQPLDEDSFPDEYTSGEGEAFKKGGKVKRSSASKRGDGIAQRGKTRGRFV
jgi:hypothetical protein